MARIEVNGTTLFYREQGTGPLALFVHGFPLDGTMWLDQIDALAGSRRCVVPDLRGYGKSEATAMDLLSMEQHADDLAALVTALGETKADVIGLSMGGYVALAMWERHPGVFRSLALIDTKSGADDEAGKARREMAAIELVTSGRKEFADGMVEALLAPHATPFAKGRLRSMIEGTRYETTVASLKGMAARPDRTGLLDGITVPTAVIVGEEDKLTPVPDSEAMAAAIAGAALHVIPGAGHMAPLERPTAVTQALLDLFDGSVA
jgi:pimeloyl-ACP methyl ester carboxylesterase